MRLTVKARGPLRKKWSWGPEQSDTWRSGDKTDPSTKSWNYKQTKGERRVLEQGDGWPGHTDRNVSPGFSSAQSTWVASSDFRLRNHLSPLHPAEKGVKSRGRVSEFLTQETRGIRRAQDRGRKKCSRREEKSGRVQMERPRADGLAPGWNKIPGT